MLPVFRYKFNDDVTTVLSKFANDNESLPKKEYKEEWKNWLSSNEDFVRNERERLTNQGYNNIDVTTKMFRTTKYYQRKNMEKSGTDDDNILSSNDEQYRKKIFFVSKDLLNTMEEHITKAISENISPSKSFQSFTDNYKSAIETEIENITTKHTTENQNSNDIQHIKSTINEKIKKTYKNKYYNVMKNKEKTDKRKQIIIETVEASL
jgi:hypothetical protein